MYLRILAVFVFFTQLAVVVPAGDSSMEPEAEQEEGFSLAGFAEQALTTVWMASCKTSQILTRSKRSLEIQQWTVPQDTQDLYGYLYPNLDMAPGDFKGQGRTGRASEPQAPEAFSVTAWLDDAMDLWTSECIRSKKTQDGVLSVHSVLKNATQGSGLFSWLNQTPFFSKKETDKFFPSYGGDLEYFFPVYGFSIPFDGEITFLGFHGFQGLFPHRRR